TFPYTWARYSNHLMNARHPASLMLLDRRRFLTMFATRRSSKAITSLDMTNAFAVLAAKSLRCLWTFRCLRPNLLRALVLLCDPFTLRETLRPRRLSALSERRRKRGFSCSCPSESV